MIKYCYLIIFVLTTSCSNTEPPKLVFEPIDNPEFPPKIFWVDFYQGNVLITDAVVMYDIFIYPFPFTGEPDVHYYFQDLPEKVSASYSPKLGPEQEQIYYFYRPFLRGKKSPYVWIINNKKEIHLKKAMPAFFNGLVVTDSAYYFFGPYKQFWVHEFDLDLNYIRSFVRIEEELGDGSEWPIPCCGVNNTFYFVHPEYNILYVVENRNLVSKICWYDTSYNFIVKIVDKDTAVQKYEGANSLMVKDRFCYISMFSHKGEKTRFWVDIIDLKEKSVVKSFNTETLYYFDNDGDKWYLTTGRLYNKKIYKIEFK